MLGGKVFGAVDETFSFPCAAVDHLKQVDHVLLVIQRPRHLVIVAGAEVDHNMSVSEEEHARALVE